MKNNKKKEKEKNKQKLKFQKKKSGPLLSSMMVKQLAKVLTYGGLTKIEKTTWIDLWWIHLQYPISNFMKSTPHDHWFPT